MVQLINKHWARRKKLMRNFLQTASWKPIFSSFLCCIKTVGFKTIRLKADELDSFRCLTVTNNRQNRVNWFGVEKTAKISLNISRWLSNSVNKSIIPAKTSKKLLLNPSTGVSSVVLWRVIFVQTFVQKISFYVSWKQIWRFLDAEPVNS